MSATRVIPQKAQPVKDGPPPEYTHKVTVNRDGVRQEMGATQNVRALSPAEARVAEADRWLPDEETGADKLYTSGKITVLSPQEAMEKAHRDAEEKLNESAEQRRAAAGHQAAAKLRDDFHAHAAKLEGMAKAAKGDSAAEARVAEHVRQSAAVGDELKRRGVL